jgi:hypothetical protein
MKRLIPLLLVLVASTATIRAQCSDGDLWKINTTTKLYECVAPSTLPVSTAQQTALDAKAPINNPTFTGTVGGITPTMVSLGNVTNTSDANKPVSTAQQTALDLKLTGTAAVLTSNATNATTTLNNLSGLSVNVTSGRKYYFVLTLMLANSVAAEGLKVDLNGGAATMTIVRAAVEGQDTTLTIMTQVSALNTVITAATFTGDGVILIRGYLNPSSTSTFIPRFAENTHVTGTLTAYTGSSLVLTEIP